MLSHRSRIKQYVVERLAPLFPTVGQVSQEILNLEDRAVNVFIERETRERVANAPRIYQCTVELVIDIFLWEESDISLELDQLCERVDVLIERHRFFGGLARDANLMTIEFSIDETTDKKLGSARMAYEVTFDRSINHLPEENL